MENTRASPAPETLSGGWMILAALRAYDTEIGVMHLYVLLARFENSRPIESTFQYVTYDRGLPWSGEIRDALRTLVTQGLVMCRHEGTARLHSLTDTGARRAEMVAVSMDHAVSAQLERDASWVRSRPFVNDLVDWTDTPAEAAAPAPPDNVTYLFHPNVRHRRRA